MKKRRFLISLGEPVPIVVRAFEKRDPIGLAVDRACAIVAAKDEEGRVKVGTYAYFALKAPIVKGDIIDIRFDIEAKLEIYHWNVKTGEKVIPVDRLIYAVAFLKVDALSMWLSYRRAQGDTTVRPFFGIVSDDLNMQVLLQQMSARWMNEIVGTSAKEVENS